jgi:hypothetical protein
MQKVEISLLIVRMWAQCEWAMQGGFDVDGNP